MQHEQISGISKNMTMRTTKKKGQVENDISNTWGCVVLMISKYAQL